MWADWEILRSKQSRGQLRYVDPRVVCEIDNKNITLIEVDSIVDAEIASHIFDSSILVLSLFDGVENDQQMTRFQFPRLIFIEDINWEREIVDQVKSNLDQVISKLNHRCAAIQVPIYFDNWCFGFVVLVKMKAYYFRLKMFVRLFDLVNKLKAYFFRSETPYYKHVEVSEVPEDMQAFVLKKRSELIEIVSEVDDKLSEAFHGGSQISESVLDDAIRRATISMKFVPIFMGVICDERHDGLELLMEGVIRYLPGPINVSNYALDQNRNGEKVKLSGSIDAPFVAKVFTNVIRNDGLVTYLRIYQGVIKKGDFITNVNTGKKIQIPRLFKRHDDKIEEVDEAHAGEIIIVLDAILKSGDTFTDGSVRYTMTSADVPDYSIS